ncbi:MAG: class I SAM-dependent methyltransferase [Nitrospira sp.]|nr:class I SAM-dependent methyltransferase [Nitrospira sp.]MDH5193007.1 class I SAM-dependent methyltransferase [Nitrospira sp.]
MACPICSGGMEFCFAATVLNKYQARYEVCENCGFLRAYEPHWLDEAYSRAIAAADSGLVMRNISIARQLAGVLYWLLGERGDGQYLDVAGGYGMLTRLMRDMGFDFYWTDKHCQNLLAPGFEYSRAKGACCAVTAVEVMEHLLAPLTFIEETLALSAAPIMLFTTELYEGPPPSPGAWWYYAFSTGQHIGFFQRRTLEALGRKVGLYYASANGLHVYSKVPVNRRLLQLVTGRWVSCVAPWWIRRRLGSKTMSDHYLRLEGNR